MDSQKKDKEKERKKKVGQLIKDLNTKVPEKISSALEGLQSHGDSSVIESILNVWLSGINEQNTNEVTNFLNDIKYSDSADFIMEAIKNKKYASLRQQLLNIVWNSKVDYSEFLVDFISIAVHGDFMETLECLTIIENLEGPFQEYQLLESQVILSEYAEVKSKSKQKAQLMSEIAVILKDIEANHVEF